MIFHQVKTTLLISWGKELGLYSMYQCKCLL